MSKISHLSSSRALISYHTIYYNLTHFSSAIILSTILLISPFFSPDKTQSTPFERNSTGYQSSIPASYDALPNTLVWQGKMANVLATVISHRIIGAEQGMIDRTKEAQQSNQMSCWYEPHYGRQGKAKAWSGQGVLQQLACMQLWAGSHYIMLASVAALWLAWHGPSLPTSSRSCTIYNFF